MDINKRSMKILSVEFIFIPPTKYSPLATHQVLILPESLVIMGYNN